MQGLDEASPRDDIGAVSDIKDGDVENEVNLKRLALESSSVNVALPTNAQYRETQSEYTLSEDLQSSWMKNMSSADGRSTPPPGQDVSVKGEFYMAFYVACRGGDDIWATTDGASVAKKLMARPDCDATQAYLAACDAANGDVVFKILHEHSENNISIDVEFPFKGSAAVILAAYQGQSNAVQEFLDDGDMDVSQRKWVGQTALQIASAFGHLDVANCVLTGYEVDVNQAAPKNFSTNLYFRFSSKDQNGARAPLGRFAPPL